MPSARITCLAFTLSAVLPLTATAAIPTATCRSTDRPETGVSGETTAAERDAGLPLQGAFKCNTDLVGQYQGEGASWQLTAWKNCAYFDQRHNAAANPGGIVETHPGTVVVDVSDPTHPTATTWLVASAMIDPWESLKVNLTRGSCSAADSGRLNAQSPGEGFSVYDIASDCKNPMLKSDVIIPGSFGHSGQWAPDGKTFYITPLRASPSIVAVNVDDPAAPFAIPGGIFTFNLMDGGTPGPQDLPLSQLHDLEFSKDGNTAYITMFGARQGRRRRTVLRCSTSATSSSAALTQATGSSAASPGMTAASVHRMRFRSPSPGSRTS